MIIIAVKVFVFNQFWPILFLFNSFVFGLFHFLCETQVFTITLVFVHKYVIVSFARRPFIFLSAWIYALFDCHIFNTFVNYLLA